MIRAFEHRDLYLGGTKLPERFLHRRDALNAGCGIFVSDHGPYWKVDHFVDFSEVRNEAFCDDCCKAVGMVHGPLPGALAAHAVTHAVEAVGIYVRVLAEDMVQHFLK